MATEEKKPDTEATKTQPASAASASQSKVKHHWERPSATQFGIVFLLGFWMIFVSCNGYTCGINGIAALLQKCT